jgi:O-antigen ligase
MIVINRVFLHDHRPAGLASWPVCQISTAWALGLVLGLVVLVLPPSLVLGGILGIVLLVAGFTNPEIVILFVLALVLDLIPARFNLPIRLPVGTLHVSDLLLIWLLAVMVVRLLVDKAFLYVKTPLDRPVLFFFAAVVVAMGTSMFRFGVRFQEAQIEARVFMYYLIFFVVTNLVRTRLQLVWLVRGIFALGLLITGTMIGQASLGRSVLLMDKSILQGGQLIRFFHPGTPVIYMLVMALICDMTLSGRDRYSLLRPLQVLVLGIGLLLTLTRHILVSSIVSLAMLIFITRKLQGSRLLGSLVLTACTAAAVAGVLGVFLEKSVLLEYLAVFLTRTIPMFSRTILTSEETLVSRWDEIRYAWAHIAERPVFGIGLWRPYRRPFYEGDTLTRYVHNAYISIWLKTGLLGLVPFLWFSVRFLQRGFQYWREVQDRFLRAVTLGFTLAYLGMMISNLTSPFFVQDWSLAIFGVVLGVTELILMHNRAIDRYEGGT